MIRKALILSIMLALSLCVLSQSRAEKKEQLEALKVKFITEELDLTAAESEQFWPVFYNYELTIKQLKKRVKRKKKALETSDLSENELTSELDEIYTLEVELAENYKSCALEMLPILGSKKTSKFVSIEDKLRKRIAQKVKSRLSEKD